MDGWSNKLAVMQGQGGKVGRKLDVKIGEEHTVRQTIANMQKLRETDKSADGLWKADRQKGNQAGRHADCQHTMQAERLAGRFNI